MKVVVLLVQVFNPHTPIYNAEERMSDFYNTSVESGEMRCLDKTLGCFPRPFTTRNVPAAPPGYSVVIDASVTGVRAQQLLSQLVYGGFMDDTTRSATVQVRVRQLTHVSDHLHEGVVGDTDSDTTNLVTIYAGARFVPWCLYVSKPCFYPCGNP